MRAPQRLLALLVVLCLGTAAHALRLERSLALRKHDHAPAGPLPLVIWHGMGDSCCSLASIGSIKKLVEDEMGVFVHSINTGSDSSEGKDVLSSFWGNVNSQVEKVCEELQSMPELEGGFNMLGVSQGGQFLRAVVQRCGHKLPPVHTLVSLGGQHQGVMNVPGCRAGMSGIAARACRAVELLVGRGAYAPWVRDNVVQAQYVKDPENLEAYARLNPFLPDINNEAEGKEREPRYAANLAALQRLVLFRFTGDTTVVPRDSSWFSFYNGTALIPLHDQPLYAEDWVGLKALDGKGGLLFDELPGEHMQFSLKSFRAAVLDKYLGGGGGARTASV